MVKVTYYVTYYCAPAGRSTRVGIPCNDWFLLLQLSIMLNEKILAFYGRSAASGVCADEPPSTGMLSKQVAKHICTWAQISQVRTKHSFPSPSDRLCTETNLSFRDIYLACHHAMHAIWFQVRLGASRWAHYSYFTVVLHRPLITLCSAVGCVSLQNKWSTCFAMKHNQQMRVGWHPFRS